MMCSIHCTMLVLWGAVVATSKGSPLLRYPAPSDTDVSEEEGSTMVKRGPVNPGMWFGPRLGRRERRGADELQEEGDGGKMDSSLVELLDSPWALIALKGQTGGRRHTMSFTPRLGRDSGEDEYSDSGLRLVDMRSPPFSPRLGRRLVPFSPRLGRERDVVYSPRLGRQQLASTMDNNTH